MTAIEIARVVKEAGLGVGAFALCAWMVVYIVKRMGTSLDKLLSRLDRFCENVRNEHENSQRQHEAIMSHHEKLMDGQKELSEQHREISDCLGRINGYKTHD